MKLFRIIHLLFLLLVTNQLKSQTTYLHSHNDYARPYPFWEAYIAGCKSIEADIILHNDTLFVAHSIDEIAKNKTFERLYIEPINQLYKNNEMRSFQLLIDIKTEAIPTLSELCIILSEYPQLFNPSINRNAIKIIISGNKPLPGEIKNFPSYIYYDLLKPSDYDDYKNNSGMVSRNFKDFTVWNGLGRPIEKELQNLKAFIDSCHQINLPVRFWNSPDTKTAYSLFNKLKVDFINTDQPTIAALFINELNKSIAINEHRIDSYQPSFAAGLETSNVKNIILLIGDGMGLSQLMAGYLGNRKQLTCTNFKYIGLSSTWSADNLGTDSAAGGTAISTGKKTKNRYIGVDTSGVPIPNIMEIVKSYGMLTGIITSDKITGATPSAFYAHQVERDSSRLIYNDLLHSNINFIAGYKPFKEIPGSGKFKIAKNSNEIDNVSKTPIMYFVESPENSRYSSSDGEFLASLTKIATKQLDNSNGFLLMVECSAIDGGGHANDLNTIVREVLNLDKAVGEVTRFADTHPGTLVIVTADHETGGLIIPAGDIQGATIEGHFFSNDHTASWVPVLAYGAGSFELTGIYENNELFKKIAKLLSNSRKK